MHFKLTDSPQTGTEVSFEPFYSSVDGAHWLT